MNDHIWDYQPVVDRVSGTDLVGYRVEATDGRIGKVDRHSDEVGSSYLVVDTGVWIFGKHVLLPAGTIVRIDPEAETIYVGRTKAEIKAAPEFKKESPAVDAAYRQQADGYYGRFPLA